MSGRLPAHLGIGALLRRVNDAGGMAMVLAKGDPHDGALLFVTYEKARFSGIFQREPSLDGQAILARVGPPDSADAEAIEDYWHRRRRTDPDLWVIELDIAAAQRFAAETIAAN